MRYFHFNLPVSVKPCASSRINWILRISMRSILSLTDAKNNEITFKAPAGTLARAAIYILTYVNIVRHI